MKRAKRALIVVDYQNDFVKGGLGFAGAECLEEAICRKIAATRALGGDILFTFDTHTENYLNTQEGKYLPIPHCIKGSDGWRLYGKVAAARQAEDCCFEKESFGSLALAEYLKDQGYEEIELCGLVSSICVISNAILAKAALPEAEICVDPEGTAAADSVMHQKALDIMAGLQICAGGAGSDKKTAKV